MTNFEKLQLTKADKVLFNFIKKRGAENLIENATFNRGDFFEMALTRRPVKRSGLHKKSNGDAMFHGLRVEIKYLTKKTGASLDLLGTNATHYLIGFNDGEKIEIRLLPKAQLKTIIDKGSKGVRHKITFQNNYGLGIKI